MTISSIGPFNFLILHENHGAWRPLDGRCVRAVAGELTLRDSTVQIQQVLDRGESKSRAQTVSPAESPISGVPRVALFVCELADEPSKLIH